MPDVFNPNRVHESGIEAVLGDFLTDISDIQSSSVGVMVGKVDVRSKGVGHRFYGNIDKGLEARCKIKIVKGVREMTIKVEWQNKVKIDFVGKVNMQQTIILTPADAERLSELLKAKKSGKLETQ